MLYLLQQYNKIFKSSLRSIIIASIQGVTNGLNQFIEAMSVEKYIYIDI